MVNFDFSCPGTWRVEVEDTRGKLAPGLKGNNRPPPAMAKPFAGTVRRGSLGNIICTSFFRLLVCELLRGWEMYPSTGRWAKCLKRRQRRSSSTGGNKLNDSRNLDVSVLPYQSISIGSKVFMYESVFSYNECALEEGRKWLIFMQKPLGKLRGKIS